MHSKQIQWIVTWLHNDESRSLVLKKNAPKSIAGIVCLCATLFAFAWLHSCVGIISLQLKQDQALTLDNLLATSKISDKIELEFFHSFNGRLFALLNPNSFLTSLLLASNRKLLVKNQKVSNDRVQLCLLEMDELWTGHQSLSTLAQLARTVQPHSSGSVLWQGDCRQL